MDRIFLENRLNKKLIQRFKSGVVLKNMPLNNPAYARFELINKQLDTEIVGLRTKLSEIELET